MLSISLILCVCVCFSLRHVRPRNSMDCSLPSSAVNETFPARILQREMGTHCCIDTKICKILYIFILNKTYSLYFQSAVDSPSQKSEYDFTVGSLYPWFCTCGFNQSQIRQYCTTQSLKNISLSVGQLSSNPGFLRSTVIFNSHIDLPNRQGYNIELCKK